MITDQGTSFERHMDPAVSRWGLPTTGVQTTVRKISSQLPSACPDGGSGRRKPWPSVTLPRNRTGKVQNACNMGPVMLDPGRSGATCHSKRGSYGDH